jgi:hypothetical protein
VATSVAQMIVSATFEGRGGMVGGGEEGKGG